MAFWGACIPGNGSYTLPSQVPPRRLRITHASNYGSDLDFLRLEVKVGENQPIPVAIVNGTTKLELEFEESDDVLFSVVGPTDVYLVGYYYQASQGQDCPNPEVGLKSNVSINPERDVEPNRGKSIKNVADMESMECNTLEERLVSNEHTPKINIQVETLGNQLSEQQSESGDMDVSDPCLVSDPEPGVIVGDDDEHNVADVDSMECNVLEEKHDRNEQTSMVNIQGDTSVNEPQKQQSEPCCIDAIVPPLISIPELGYDLVITGRKKQKKRKLVSEEKIHEDPIPLEPGDDGTRQVRRKETKKKMTRKISGEAEDIVEDSRNKCGIDGCNDEHKATDSSDFSINAQEKEEAIIVEIARHHSEALQDVDAGVQCFEMENMVDKLDETQVLGVTSADEKLSSDATVCAKRGCDLDVTGRKKQKKRVLVSEEKIQEDSIPLEQGDDRARPVKRTAANKKKTRKVTSGEAEDIIEDSSNKKNSDLVPAKEKKKAKKDKYIFISRAEHELDDNSKMNNDTFEAVTTKVKSAKTESKKPVTSGVPNEQSNTDFAHIVLGLASSEFCPKNGKTRRSH